MHWEYMLKPILLAHHHNALHSYDRPRFLRYVLKTGVEYTQDIDWKKALKKFPSQTCTSLNALLGGVYAKCKYKGNISKADTLNVAIEKYIQTTPTEKAEYTKKEKKHRDEIVSCYLAVCSGKTLKVPSK